MPEALAPASLPPDLLRSLTHLASTTPYGLHSQWIPLAQSALYAARTTYGTELTAEDLLGLLTWALRASLAAGVGWQNVCAFADVALASLAYQREGVARNARYDPDFQPDYGSLMDYRTPGHRRERQPGFPQPSASRRLGAPLQRQPDRG